MNKKYFYLAIIFILGLFIGGKWNIPLAAWIVPIFGIRFFRDSDKAGRSGFGDTQANLSTHRSAALCH